MAKAYQYILLDWDGNLAKTLDLWQDAFHQVLVEAGFEPDDREISDSFGHVEDYFAKIGVKNPAELFARADQIGRQKLPEVELYPDALEVLNYFKDIGKQTALITSSNRANVVQLLDHYNMNELFDAFVAREDAAEQKPAPEALLKGVEKLGGSVQQALMIGDTDKDIGAANNAGMDSVLFFPPEHEKFYDLQKFKKLQPTYVVDDFRKIMHIVQ